MLFFVTDVNIAAGKATNHGRDDFLLIFYFIHYFWQYLLGVLNILNINNENYYIFSKLAFCNKVKF